MKKICFTGYRPFKLPFKIDKSDLLYINFYKRAYSLIREQIECGNTYFICGMAQGADLLLARIVLRLKTIYSEVFLECALPFVCQSEKWTAKHKNLYDDILKQCDKVTVLSECYRIDAYLKRNKYMVDNSDIVIAVFDGKKGGTKFTCDYALKKGKQLIVLNPKQNETVMQTEIKLL